MANGKVPPREMMRATGIGIPTRKIPLKKIRLFDPGAFLAQAGVGRRIVDLKKDQTIFSQGDAADTIFYIQKGKAKLTVVSSSGKEATIALLGAGDFLGEECIANSQPLRMATATAISEGKALRIDRKEMIRALHQEHDLSQVFVSYLFPICWPATFAFKKTWLINCLIPAKNVWPGFFCCSLSLASKAHRRP